MRKTSWVCRVFVLFLCLLGIGYSVPVLLEGNLYEVLIRLSILFTAFLPTICRRWFHLHITPIVEIIYLIFLFFGHFLGSIVGLYNEIPLFDKFVHMFSGVLTACLALILLNNIGKYQEKSMIFNILFMVSFTLAVASFWEFFEYGADIFFKADAQHVSTTGVNDTMLDMIVAFLGSIIVCVVYGWEILSKNVGFIRALVNR